MLKRVTIALAYHQAQHQHTGLTQGKYVLVHVSKRRSVAHGFTWREMEHHTVSTIQQSIAVYRSQLLPYASIAIHRASHKHLAVYRP